MYNDLINAFNGNRSLLVDLPCTWTPCNFFKFFLSAAETVAVSATTTTSTHSMNAEVKAEQH